MSHVALRIAAEIVGGGALLLWGCWMQLGCSPASPATDSRPPAARFAASPPLGPAPELAKDAANRELLTAMHDQLRPGWHSFVEDCRTRLPPDHPLNRGDLLVRLRLVIDSRGSLSDVDVVQPSGVAEFDRAAIEVVRDAAPFKAPAESDLSDDGRLHLTWAFARDVRQASPAHAELLRVTWPIEDVVARLIEAGRLDQAAVRLAQAIEEELAAGPVGDIDQSRMVEALDRLSLAVIERAFADGDRQALLHAVAAVREGNLRDLIPALRQLAGGVSDASVRAAAARALGALDDRDALDTLRKLTLDTSGPVEVVSAAATALVDLGAAAELRVQARNDLASDDDAIRWRGLLLASHVDVPEQRGLLEEHLHGTGETDRLERMAAAQALGAIAGAGGAIGQEALSDLVRGLAAKDASIRAASARAIASAASAGATSLAVYRKVTARLSDRDERVRAAAVTAAAALAPRRFAGIVDRLRRERSDIVLVALADALAEVPGPAARARLVELANHSQASVRSAAARAVARRSDAADVLAGWLAHPDADRRQMAIAASDPETARARLHAGKGTERVWALERLLQTAPSWPLAADAAALLAQADHLTARAAVARAWLSRDHRLN